MTTEKRNCPDCGSEMSFRLGMFECAQCGHTEQDNAAVAERTPASGPGFRREVWPRRPAPRRASAAPAMSPDAKDESPSLSRGGISSSGDQPFADDKRPTPAREKMLMLGFFLTKGVVNALIGLLVIGSRDWAAVGGSLASQLIAIGLLALVLYVPLGFIKYIVGFCSCAYALYTLAGLLLGILLVPMLGLLMPFGAGLGLQLLGAVGVVLTLADVLGYLWLASLLFRDLQKF